MQHGNGTIETRDGWDTIDWLVNNVPNNNGCVGIMGVSYSGYTAAATLLDPHPALKAVSEQAAGPVDEWMHDDDHRYGALRLSYDIEYAVLEENDKLANWLTRRAAHLGSCSGAHRHPRLLSLTSYRKSL